MTDSPSSYDGFTFVRDELFGCGREVSMMRVYRFDLFAELIDAGVDAASEGDSRVEFIEIPSTTFRRGATDAEIDAMKHHAPAHDSPLGKHETPAYDVTLPTFLVSRTLVTQELWDGVAERFELELWDQRNLQGPYIPVHGITPAAVEPFLTATGLALPTEAQWECAARGGAETLYFHGDDPGDLKQYAWFGYVGESGPMSVAQRDPNAFGLFDMTGNVWELCRDDWTDDYSNAPADGSAVRRPDAMERVIRGGSFRVDSPTYLVPSYRSYTGIWATPIDVGFRVVFEPDVVDGTPPNPAERNDEKR